MAFTRATYNSKTVTKVLDSSQLATNQEKYWNTEEGVSDTIGVWDDINNNFIPDGWYDETTCWLWPEGLDWSEYNAGN
tara:strand:- start:447 stop:680 length:234 start_codon:yes stop_codon:yes gene_type:complete